MSRRLIAYETFRALRQAREFIAENALEPVSLADAARFAGYSPFHFQRRFIEVFGESPQEMRTRIRLEEAKRLLRVSQLSVTEICYEIGYGSLGSFSSMFTDRTGCAPSEFRRKFAFPGLWSRRVIPGCFFTITALTG